MRMDRSVRDSYRFAARLRVSRRGISTTRSCCCPATDDARCVRFMRLCDIRMTWPTTRARPLRNSRRSTTGGRQLDATLTGGVATWPGLPALADTVNRYGISAGLLREVIDGVVMDVQPARFADLRRPGRLLLPRRLGCRSLLSADLGLSVGGGQGRSIWRRSAASRCN